MTAWFWRRGRKTPTSTSISLFPLSPGASITAGAVGGALYLGLLLLIHIFERIPFSTHVWLADVWLAAAMQASVAVYLSFRCLTLREVHALFGAFTSGALMTGIILFMMLAFGLRIDLEFTWLTFLFVANSGAFAAMVVLLPIGLIRATNNKTPSGVPCAHGITIDVPKPAG
jgi:hypothetical protein